MHHRFLARLGLLCLLLACCGFWVVLRLAAIPAPPPSTSASNAAASDPGAGAPNDTDDDASVVRRTTLGSGGTLDSALGRLGLSPALRRGALEVVGHYFNARRLPPQTGLSAEFDASGVARTLCLRSEPTRYLRIVVPNGSSEDDYRAELVELPVETSVESTAGVVRHSVAQALSGLPLGGVLTHAVADVFQWDIDLLVDPRPGDEIRIVYEAERLASVPDELPGFGDAPSTAGEVIDLGRILAASYRGVMAESLGFWIESDDGGGYYDADGRPLRRAFLKSPLNYRRISSGYSNARRNPVTRAVVPHHGVDFAAAPGTPVVATAQGKVIAAGWDGPLGRAVRIRHTGGFVTVYGHLQGFARGIRVGAAVDQNDVIGYVGSSGRATGPHLHYAMYRGSEPVNPLTLANPPVEPLSAARRGDLHAAKRRWLPVLEPAAPFELQRRTFALEPIQVAGQGS